MFFFYTRATDRLLGTAGGPKKTRILVSLNLLDVPGYDTRFCSSLLRAIAILWIICNSLASTSI